MNRRWWAAGASAAAVGMVALVVACSSGGSGNTAASSPKVPAFTPPPTRSSAAPSAQPKLCTDVAQESDVDAIVGHPLNGGMSQVVGLPVPSINRTGRLDCYYGVATGQPATSGVISVTVATYSDDQSAAHRTTLTVNQARNSGATTNDVTFNGNHAVLIAGQQGQELVLSSGDRTVLVNAANGVLTQGKANQQLEQLAQRGLAAKPTG